MLPTLLLLVPPAHAASGMSLIPDPFLTVVQMVPFFATMAMLHFIIFKPMMEYLAERDASTVGARDDALRLTQEADQKLTQYEEQLAVARSEIGEMRAARRAEALVAREATLAQARSKAETRITDALEVVEGERELASQELERLSRSLAQQISSKVLGREVAA